MSVPAPGPSDARAEVPLGAYLRATRAHPLVVIASVLAAAAGGLLFTSGAATYKATARMLVTPVSASNTSYTSLPLPRAQGDPQRSVQTAAGILESPGAAERTAELVPEVGSPDDVRRRVEVGSDPESNTVTITAEAPQAAGAAELANAYAEATLESRATTLRPLIAAALRSARTELLDLPDDTGDAGELLRQRIADLESIRGGVDPTISLIQEATVPLEPAGLGRPVVLALALIAGAVIGLVASLLIELLVPRRVRRETDILQRYPLAVLARVPPEPVRLAGQPGPEASVVTAEVYRSLRTQLEVRFGPAGQGESRVVVVTSSNRGDGRTTTAIGLAQAITRSRQTAVLIELDLRAPALAERLGVEPAYDARAPRHGASLLDMRRSPPGDSKLSVLAAAPVTDPSAVDRIVGLAQGLLADASSLADWVIVDAPPLSEASAFLAMGGEWDQLVLVSRVGHTNEGDLVASRDLLSSLGVEPAGHVVIGPPRQRNGGATQARVGRIRRAGRERRSAAR